ncbi:MAG: two component transcriptional regulator, AraC family [Herbinix sp.]|jgi:two-component system response regulator YesN|nr:two component transcriptional regulator, AraC family [Herbinix sp.]
MFKVLLVDDEILTREAISMNIPWEEQGFCLIGTAENGQEAIEQMKHMQPDLVITDICMPYMDGLELANYIHQNFPDTKVVILSGHDEFEYARHALAYHVKEYILKPITSLELKEVLKRVRISLEEEAGNKAHLGKMQLEYHKNIPVLRERFLRRIIEERYQGRDIYDKMNGLNINLYGDFYTVILVYVEDAQEFCLIYPDSEDDLIRFTTTNIISEIMEEVHAGIAVQLSEHRMALLFAADCEQELERQVDETCHRILKSLWDFVKIKVSFSVGITVNTPYSWWDSYRNAKEASEYKFISGKNDFIYGRDLKKYVPMNEPISVEDWSDRLTLQIKLNQKQELERSVTELFQEIKSKCNLRKDIILYAQNIFLSIVFELRGADVDREPGYTEERIVLRKLMDSRYLSELEYDFKSLCTELMNKICGNKDGESRKLIILAMDYIEKNYADSNISLNIVCSYLGVSISYFSINFKNYTGETFVEALTRIRIDKAKKMMDVTDLKTYEIADRVGYNDAHYFSMIFKKTTGMTPSEYAKNRK